MFSIACPHPSMSNTSFKTMFNHLDIYIWINTCLGPNSQEKIKFIARKSNSQQENRFGGVPQAQTFWPFNIEKQHYHQLATKYNTKASQ